MYIIVDSVATFLQIFRQNVLPEIFFIFSVTYDERYVIISIDGLLMHLNASIYFKKKNATKNLKIKFQKYNCVSERGTIIHIFKLCSSQNIKKQFSKRENFYYFELIIQSQKFGVAVNTYFCNFNVCVTVTISMANFKLIILLLTGAVCFTFAKKPIPIGK